MGYKTHADFVLEVKMAKTSEKVKEVSPPVFIPDPVSF